MRASDAAAELRHLLELESDVGREPVFLEWWSKVGVVLRAAFGAESAELRQFVAVATPKREGYTTARGDRRDWENYRADAARRGCGIIKSAIYALETLGDKSPMDDASIDPELWGHVHGLVADDDWAKVPAAVAIFVEDKVRTWAGDPQTPQGATMIGKSLYGSALNESGELRLGRQASEWEGWRSLGQGLALAIGNVDRHRIQQRSDVRRYAMGVLGLGSLLLTQLRYEHAARIQEGEAEGEALGERSDWHL